MKTTAKLAAMVLMGLGLVLTSEASAQVGLRVAPLLAPELRLRPPVEDYNPRLGFRGHYDAGLGMHVEDVLWNTPASRTGLEPGDVIRSINGQRIRSLAHYQALLRQGAGRAVLTVIDVRTGQWVQREIWYERPVQVFHDHAHHHSARPIFGGPRPY